MEAVDLVDDLVAADIAADSGQAVGVLERVIEKPVPDLGPVEVADRIVELHDASISLGNLVGRSPYIEKLADSAVAILDELEKHEHLRQQEDGKWKLELGSDLESVTKAVYELINAYYFTRGGREIAAKGRARLSKVIGSAIKHANSLECTPQEAVKNAFKGILSQVPALRTESCKKQEEANQNFYTMLAQDPEVKRIVQDAGFASKEDLLRLAQVAEIRAADNYESFRSSLSKAGGSAALTAIGLSISSGVESKLGLYLVVFAGASLIIGNTIGAIKMYPKRKAIKAVEEIAAYISENYENVVTAKGNSINPAKEVVDQMLAQSIKQTSNLE